MTVDDAQSNQYLADDPLRLEQLPIRPHFEALSDKEKLYIHYVGCASFAGTRIIMRQVSPESEAIFDFIMTLHRQCNGDWAKLGRDARVFHTNFRKFLNYAAQFLGNLGNFRGMGDRKIVPRIFPGSLAALAGTSPEALSLYKRFKQGFHDTSGPQMHIGYPDEGHVSGFYPDSPNITKEEIEHVAQILERESISPENTRIRKTHNGDFEVLIASVNTNGPESQKTEWPMEGNFDGRKIRLTYGDHKRELQKIVEILKKAKEHALTQFQQQYYGEIIKSFQTGSIEAYEEAQRHWVRDEGDPIEANLGFNHTYRDPHGTRAQFDGFSAFVNKQLTQRVKTLVQSAPQIIPKLPWSKDFEPDSFAAPKYTSLEVLNFATIAPPTGINLPNSKEICETVGFKNVTLTNIYNAQTSSSKMKMPFIREDDQALMKQQRAANFEIHCSLHELFGHGCGKLFKETRSGQYNFDIERPPLNPLTGKPISLWYKPDQTYKSVFGLIGASIEECRAEAITMSLCSEPDILRIFGVGDGTEDTQKQMSECVFAIYLRMAYDGIDGLQYWDPINKWGQAHSEARFAILQVFLRAGDDFCKLQYKEDGDMSDLTIHLDRTKIESHGRPAVNAFLQKIQIYRSTADVEAATKLFAEYTHVDEWWEKRVRPQVIRQVEPINLLVQANTVIEEGKVVLREYEPTPEGMIQSFVDRDYI